jgi:hypothetical protein
LEDAAGDVGLDGERVGCAHGDEEECGRIQVGVDLAGLWSALQCGELFLEAFVALGGIGVVGAGPDSGRPTTLSSRTTSTD